MSKVPFGLSIGNCMDIIMCFVSVKIAKTPTSHTLTDSHFQTQSHTLTASSLGSPNHGFLDFSCSRWKSGMLPQQLSTAEQTFSTVSSTGLLHLHLKITYLQIPGKQFIYLPRKSEANACHGPKEKILDRSPVRFHPFLEVNFLPKLNDTRAWEPSFLSAKRV